MMRETASCEMERQEGREPVMAANRFPSFPSNCSDSPKVSLALRTHRTRSTTPSGRCSASSASAQKELPGDPLGSGSYLRGMGLRPGRASRSLSPRKKIVPIVGKKQDEARCVDESVMVDVLEYLPMEVAKGVINMQQHYAAVVEELGGKLGSLNEEMRAAREENEELKKRLDMHLVMLRQANEFMQSVRNGSFGGVERADVPTLVEEEDAPTGGVDMELPPTPVADREPVRSTGRKATKRRPAGGNHGLRRGQKMQTRAKRRAATEESAANSKGKADDATETHREEASSLGRLREEGVPQESDHGEGGADGQDEDDDGFRVLAGAPRLQALLRKSAWTAINNQRNDTDPNADFRPCSPASASESSSSSLPSPSPSPSPPPPRTPSRHKTTTPTKSSSAQTQTQSQPPLPRYSVSHQTTGRRFASGPEGRPFEFFAMARTVLGVWKQYKQGCDSNPAIEFLEMTQGTGWRLEKGGKVSKYASNYVGVRRNVVRLVERICERRGIPPEEACRLLGERADGRIGRLVDAARKGQDPFEVIPKKVPKKPRRPAKRTSNKRRGKRI